MTPTLRAARRRPALSPQAAARLAWSLCGLTWLLVLGGLTLALLSGPDVRPEGGFTSGIGVFPVIAAAFATMGALVAARHPRNQVGWISCAAGVGWASAGFATEYAIFALLAQPDGLPGGQAMAWLAEWAWLPGTLVATFVLLLFPDGRLPSPGWRPVGWLTVAAVTGLWLTEGFAPGTLVNVPVDNPLGLGGIGGQVADALSVSYVLITVANLAAMASLVVRLRRSTGEERLQVKWLASGGTVLLVGGPISEVTGSPLPVAVGAVAVAVAVGVGILKYRLYDIDLVINRALVYGALTATLAAAYLGAVLVLQLALSPLTGSSGPAVAASTLAVAALFRPARARIQGAVDRRFYRGRYDAARTLEQFGARLRDEVDLDAAVADLRAVVAETLQPSHVSVWLRPQGDLR